MCEQSGGETALFIVCQRGFVDMLDILLADGRSNYNKPNAVSETPLFIAAYNGLALGFGALQGSVCVPAAVPVVDFAQACSL